jgi:hypothetical protein
LAEDIDPHWYFKRDDGPPPIPLPPVPEEARVLEPEVVKTRGRPKKTNSKMPDTSTRREPSSFELIDKPSSSTGRRGRPPGSKNKPKATQKATHQQPVDDQNHEHSGVQQASENHRANLQEINQQLFQQAIQQAVQTVLIQGAPAPMSPIQQALTTMFNPGALATPDVRSHTQSQAIS